MMDGVIGTVLVTASVLSVRTCVLLVRGSVAPAWFRDSARAELLILSEVALFVFGLSFLIKFGFAFGTNSEWVAEASVAAAIVIAAAVLWRAMTAIVARFVGRSGVAPGVPNAGVVPMPERHTTGNATPGEPPRRPAGSRRRAA